MKRPTVWVVFAIFVFLLGFLTFGDYFYRYSGGTSLFVMNIGLKEWGGIPNYGVFFTYLLGGAIIALVLEKTKKAEPNNEKEVEK